MSEQPKRFTVTAALPYANGPIHIGHLAGAYLPADIFVRYLWATGQDVLFVCGTDEHGVPITIKAKKEGINPQAVADKYHDQIKQSFADFGIGFDIFSRTTNPTHHETASAFFKELYDKDIFTEQETEQYYDAEFNQFLADRLITGTCPKCSHPSAYGDQCENCGSSLSPTELINPVSTLSGKTPELRKTKNWFLPLDQMQQAVATYIESHKSDWKTNVYGQCHSWLNDGLKPRAMTRDLDWGVPVPVPDAEGKVLYVWFDAPIGYISATKEYFAQQGNPENWKDYWLQQNDSDQKLVHFIGKDNIVFHCIIFPAMLMAHNQGKAEAEQFLLADNVPANEFMNLQGQKISTSRNWAVWLHEYLTDFPNRRDELRYVLTSIAPETKDSDFSWKDYQARVNNELVAILGNFVNRVMVLTKKYYEGQVPAWMPAGSTHTGDWGQCYEKSVEELDESIKRLEDCLKRYKFREAQAIYLNIARNGNKFLADTEPWKLIKTDPEAVQYIMHYAVQLCANLAIYGAPFLPDTCAKIKQLLNHEALPEALHWGQYPFTSLIPTGHQLNKPELLFQNIEDEVMDQQIAKLESSLTTTQGQTVEPAKDEITFDDFTKLDIRVGTILEATKVPKADKLLQLTVDTGLDQRTVVSGIAQHFDPEKIVGRQVSILVNLQPRKIRGVLSHGMILMAEDDQGNLSFIPPTEELPNGSVVR